MHRGKLGRMVAGISVLVALSLMLWRYVYPVAIAAWVAPSAAWAMSSSAKTRGEVYAILGKPDENVCAKDYENWLAPHWWGMEQLKVVAEGCTPDARLSSIYYILRVDGFYEPATNSRLK